MTYRDPDSGLEFASEEDYERERREWQEREAEDVGLPVLGKCIHGVDLDRQFCPHGCRV